MKIFSKTILLVASALAMTSPVWAGINVHQIGSNNTMVRVSGDEKYHLF